MSSSVGCFFPKALHVRHETRVLPGRAKGSVQLAGAVRHLESHVAPPCQVHHEIIPRIGSHPYESLDKMSTGCREKLSASKTLLSSSLGQSFGYTCLTGLVLPALNSWMSSYTN